MRYDLHVRALGGPQRGQELRGKGAGDLVEIGKQPRSGGITLPVRALAPVHATVQLQDGRAIATPIGDLPVRLAPHANIDWSRMEPLRQPSWWNPGGVLYLGRPGQGVALELIEVKPLGEWTRDDRVSPSHPIKVVAPRLPLVAVGCGMVSVVSCLAGAVGIWFVALNEPVEILPVEGDVAYAFAAPERSKILDDEGSGLEGLERAWAMLQVDRSADLAEPLRNLGDRRDKASWDRTAFEHFVASAEKHAGSKSFYRRIEAIRPAWARVRQRVTDRGLPEVITAIPMTESRYRPRARSEVCARGFWQLMPETAARVGVAVSGCKILRDDGSYGSFTPEGLAPPRDAVYLDRRGPELACRLEPNGCAVDERSDLDKSTDGALATLLEAWRDPTLQASGAGVMLTVLSHNAGFDDSRFRVPRSTNILPAYTAWTADRREEVWHTFYGENLACRGKDAMSRLDVCGDSVLAAQTQHYGYTVFGQYLVAMCYLAANYPEDHPDWADLSREDSGPCRRFRIPSPGEL